MFRRKVKSGGKGSVDGGEGRGVPLGGSDVRPPTGYQWDNDSDWIEELREFSDRDFGSDEDGGPDRRRDPLRR